MFEFIETPFFAKAVERYLDDDEYAELQAYLNQNPEAGGVVRGAGGVRKLRWAAAGGGNAGVVCASSILCVSLGATFGCLLFTAKPSRRTSRHTRSER